MFTRVSKKANSMYFFMAMSKIPGALDFGLENEIRWSEELRKRGFHTPRIIKVDKNGYVREFIEGKTIDEGLSLKSIYRLGILISQLHNSDISLGVDTKLENFVIDENKICILDAEFAGNLQERDSMVKQLLKNANT